jgi:hypothetical protein
MASTARNFGQLPLWRRVILLLLAPIVFPVSLLVVLLFLTPVAIVNGICYGVYWVRWKIVGVPIPPKAPPAI